MLKPTSRRLGVALGLTLALSACASGPDYQRPLFDLPSRWSKAPATPSLATPLPPWQDYFSDQQLQALITQALAHNHDLRVASARLAEARAQYGIQHSQRFPELDVVAKRDAARIPGELNSSGQSMVSQRLDVGLELVNYEIDFWGRIKRLDEAALANYLASEAAQRAFRLSLIADVAQAYYSQCELGERLALARRTLNNREEFAAISEGRLKAGLIGSLEYLRATTILEASRAELAALEQAKDAADHWLQLLTGQMLATAPQTAPQPLASQPLKELAPGLPAEVLLRRPDVLAAEQRLVAANANIGAARAAFLPSLSLTGLLSTASNGLSGLFEAGSRAWTFKPMLRLPIYSAGRLAGNVDLAEARKDIAVVQYEQALQQAFREVADLLSARSQLKTQLTAQQTQLAMQDQRLKLIQARYRAQISHYQEVLDVEREQQASQQAVLQLQRALLGNAALLYKALGGGAEADSHATTPDNVEKSDGTHAAVSTDSTALP